VPFNNHLFFTDIVNDLNLINDLICEAKKGLTLSRTLPKKVLAYYINGGGCVAAPSPAFASLRPASSNKAAEQQVRGGQGLCQFEVFHFESKEVLDF